MLVEKVHVVGNTKSDHSDASAWLIATVQLNSNTLLTRRSVEVHRTACQEALKL